MSFADIIILILIVAGGVYGFLRGVRPALYLLICLLTSVLAIMFLTAPMEGLLIRLSGLDPTAYAGAPAVAAFILEGEDVMAYTASIIPLFLTLLVIVVFSILGKLGQRFLAEPGSGALTRVFGLPVGLVGGAILAVIFAVQLVRLPRPLAGSMVRDSLLLNALSGAADFLLPTLAGGI